jgi:hypothetical protein
MKLYPEHKKMVREYIKRLYAVQELAEELPYFKDYIVGQSLTHTNGTDFSNAVSKKVYLPHGLRRYLGKGNPHGYDGVKIKGYYWNLYINCLSTYNRHENYDLFKMVEESGVELIYMDKTNSTFYCRDKSIGQLIEVLSSWYKQAKERAKVDFKREKLEKLKKELEDLEK